MLLDWRDAHMLSNPLVKKLKQNLNSHKSILKSLTANELKIVKEIEKRTTIANKNNISRTSAYLEFYLDHEEIDWAFLAHMVSRNAGWNMTDLKGTYLPFLLNEEEQEYFFLFLERCNWLIFQDAYPQLLLYAYCKKENKDYFHLLSHFGVSVFMEHNWRLYYTYKDASLLTVALIINEQHYIEERVIQNAHYKATIMESIDLKVQDWFQLNFILFPTPSRDLFGQSIQQFQLLKERIAIGKFLYSLLFHKDYFSQFLTYAKNTSHTGSRKDYWPDLFHDVNNPPSNHQFYPIIEGCSLVDLTKKIYSPVLVHAWKDIDHTPSKRGDWYKNTNILAYYRKQKKVQPSPVSDSYCQALNKMELAILTKQKFK